MFSFFNGPVFLSLSGGSRQEIPQRVHGVRAMTFDVFGTVVDWRSWGGRHRIQADWWSFADDWRGGYGPAMQ